MSSWDQLKRRLKKAGLKPCPQCGGSGRYCSEAQARLPEPIIHKCDICRGTGGVPRKTPSKLVCFLGLLLLLLCGCSTMQQAHNLNALLHKKGWKDFTLVRESATTYSYEALYGEGKHDAYHRGKLTVEGNNIRIEEYE